MLCTLLYKQFSPFKRWKQYQTDVPYTSVQIVLLIQTLMMLLERETQTLWRPIDQADVVVLVLFRTLLVVLAVVMDCIVDCLTLVQASERDSLIPVWPIDQAGIRMTSILRNTSDQVNSISGDLYSTEQPYHDVLTIV